MNPEKLAITIVPTPATQDISDRDLKKLSRITKLPEDRLKQRISNGKSIIIVTPMHPRLDEFTNLIKAFGFSVNVSPADPKMIKEKKAITQASIKTRGKEALDETEWKVGDVIENLYDVLDIKQGGMGAVYIVRHKRWNHMIAVKSLLQKLGANEDDKALFTKEAETWIDIGFHPNIAACYYVRNILGSPRIFIEYVDGGGLNEWLMRKKPVHWDLILDLMIQVCDGLQHAHSKGLVHRDIKPANCMITQQGTLKVTDFGLTKRRGPTGAAMRASDATDSIIIERESVTAAGMGTPGYMAPEMWIPYSEVGPPADIYAFGVMFFEICCGRKPFVIKPGEKRDRLALAHVKQKPPLPSSIKKEIPKPIEELILQCLQKSPEDRFESFKVIREHLALIYRQVCKKEYLREAPDELKLLGDALNNRAVSLMDLNHEDEAELALKRAIDSDPHHPEAIYNSGLMQWFRTGLPDPDLIARLEEVTKTPEYMNRGSNLLARFLLAQGHAERALDVCRMAGSHEYTGDDRLKPLAISLMGSGKLEEAVSQFDAYLRKYGPDEEVAGRLISSLAALGRIGEAGSCLEFVPISSEYSKQHLEFIANSFAFPSSKELFRATGHSGWITCLAESPRSSHVVTGARDRNIIFWDSETGEKKRSINLVGEPPFAILISPDEAFAAIVSMQKTSVKILDLDSGKFIGNIQIPQGVLTCFRFTLDGRFLITVEEKGTVRIWDLISFKTSETFKVPQHTASGIAFDNANELVLFTAGLDKIIRKIKPYDGVSESFDRIHKETITAINPNQDGSKLLSIGKDKQCIVWDTQSGRPVRVSQIHSEFVTCSDLSPDGELAATYDPKGGIYLWSTKSGMVLRNYSSDSEVLCLRFHHSGNKLTIAGKNMQVRSWRVNGRPYIPQLALAQVVPLTKQLKLERKYKIMLETAQKAMRYGRLQIAYNCLRDSQKLVGYERSETVLDLIARISSYGTINGFRSAWQKRCIDTGSGIMSIIFSTSGIHFVTGHSDHSVRVWSAKRGDPIRILRGHTNLVTALTFSLIDSESTLGSDERTSDTSTRILNKKELISGSDDRSIRVWDYNSGKIVSVLKGHNESVSSISVNNDGTRMVSGSWDKSLKLWKLPEGSLIRTIKAHDDRISAVTFVNDGKHIISAGHDCALKMWDADSGRLLRDLRGHKDKISTLNVSSMRNLLASGSADATVRIWNIKTGTCDRVLEVGSPVRALAFSPDPRFILTGSADGIVRLWNTDDGECKREFLGHSKEISCLDFAAGGRYAISAGIDGIVMLWEFDWDWDFPHRIERNG